MKYFIDTEFSEAPGCIDLISLALVDEDGRELYAVLNEGWSPFECNAWVQEHVLPNLAAPEDYEGAWKWVSRDELRDAVLEFVNEGKGDPEFWGYYADYDWVVFCWLFGAMVDLPKGWPMFCRDLKQVAAEKGVRVPHSNDTHNALVDARDLARNYRDLVSQGQRT